MIRVVVDDLAFLAVDAVLRPADEHLEPVTPAAVRLDAQGGARLLDQRRLQSPLETGAAVVTGGGDLTAPFIIHVVVQSRSHPLSREGVRRALVSGWQRAEAWQLYKVAAPLVGAGPGGLAVEEAAALLVETWRSGFDPGHGGRLLDIVLEHEADRPTVEAVLGRSGS